MWSLPLWIICLLNHDKKGRNKPKVTFLKLFESLRPFYIPLSTNKKIIILRMGKKDILTKWILNFFWLIVTWDWLLHQFFTKKGICNMNNVLLRTEFSHHINSLWYMCSVAIHCPLTFSFFGISIFFFEKFLETRRCYILNL